MDSKITAYYSFRTGSSKCNLEEGSVDFGLRPGLQATPSAIFQQHIRLQAVNTNV